MTLLPVVARELRVASRRSWTYWVRVLAGGMALILASWLALVGTALGATGNGEPLFYALAVPAFGFACLGGLLHAADAISGEKRDGTLGLLFLTDLRGHDVTLGKLAGTSLGAVYGLVAMLPFLALTLLLGGITAADYGRMVLLLLTTLFTSLATGLLASAFTTDVRRSVLLAFLLMLEVVIGMPTACASVSWALARHYGDPNLTQIWDNGWFQNLSPAVGFGFVGAKSYQTGASRYWISIGFTAAVGLLSLTLASWRLPYAWQEAGSPPGWRGGGGWLNRLRFPNPDSMTRFRRAILDVHAVTWLTARHWIRPWLPWLFLLGVVAAVSGITAQQDGDWWDIEVSFALSAMVHAVFKLWMANEAPRQFLEDRRTGAMELLLSTPLSTAEILAGHSRGLRRQFLGPVVLILLVDFYWMVTGGMEERTGGVPTLAILWLLRMILLVLDLWTLKWAGFWAGMTGRGRATTTSLVFRILVLPWLLWFLVATFMGISLSRNSGDDSLMWLMIGSWFVLAVGSDLLWATRARSALADNFREAATRHPGESRQWFRKGPPAS